jgi:hypothetical protein
VQALELQLAAVIQGGAASADMHEPLAAAQEAAAAAEAGMLREQV